MKKRSFRQWFEECGNELLSGWLRAKEDGNDEPFTDWVIGEYEFYLKDGDRYEIPYHGLFDNPAHVEAIIYQHHLN